MELDANDFRQIRDLVYQRTGMMFEERKREFVRLRIARRLDAVGCRDARDYYRYLRYHDANGEELQCFIESLTTNETYFFREYPQLECFANELLPEVCRRKQGNGERRLRIWSAACSTGDEPYTLAIILQACLEDVARWKIDVLATDIDRNVLAVARRGVYSQRAVKDVPDVYLKEYFTKSDQGYRVTDRIRRMVRFEQLNLLDEAMMRLQRRCDFIFCRNVLIYFDDAARAKVLDCFREALNPGGYIFLGHSESVGRISRAFESVSCNGHTMYRRPLDAEQPSNAIGAVRSGR